MLPITQSKPQQLPIASQDFMTAMARLVAAVEGITIALEKQSEQLEGIRIELDNIRTYLS